MRDKIVPRSELFDCPKCKRAVTFRYEEKQSFANEIPEPLLKVVDKITSYGQCQIADQAKFPHNPTTGEMNQCPVYQILIKRYLA